ncbi:MAG: halocyanin domain-containing protein [Halorhabdus sp.]
MARRRQFLGSLAGAVTAGSLAGCAGESATTTERTYPAYTDVPNSVQTFLSNTSNFDGSGVDATDATEVSVTVGAPGNGSNWAFAPAVVAVSTGTTVVWQWNGKGGAHNVVSAADREPLDSGAAVPSDSATYEYTFQNPGAYRYVCIPHRAYGMKGAVLVE